MILLLLKLCALVLLLLGSALVGWVLLQLEREERVDRGAVEVGGDDRGRWAA